MALLVLSVASAGFVSILSGLRTRIARWIALLTVALAAVSIQVPSVSMRRHMLILA